jgi:hypothetical protein
MVREITIVNDGTPDDPSWTASITEDAEGECEPQYLMDADSLDDMIEQLQPYIDEHRPRVIISFRD